MFKNYFSIKINKTQKQFLKLFMGVCFVVLLLFTSPIFYNLALRVVDASSEDKIKLEVFQGRLSGNYSIINENSNLAFDIYGERFNEEKTPIISYPVHNNSNQIFNFEVVEVSNEHGYIYNLLNTYDYYYALDLNKNSSADGTVLQIYRKDGTVGQKFAIKEVYEFEQNMWKFRGYVIATGPSNYTKVLKNNGTNKQITQVTFNKYQLDKNTLWHFKFKPSVKGTEDSSFKNLSSIGLDYFENSYTIRDTFLNFIVFNEKSTSGLQRMNANGAPLYDKNLTLSLNYRVEPTYYIEGNLFNKSIEYKLNNSGSTLVDGYPFPNKLGYFGLVVNYSNNESKPSGGVPVKFSREKNSTLQTLNFTNTPEFYHTNNGNLVFDKIGSYEVSVYYSIFKINSYIGTTEHKRYVKLSFTFEIVNTDSDLEVIDALDTSEEIKTIAGYTLSLNAQNDIEVSYSGSNEKYNIDKTRIISYILSVNNAYAPENENALNELKNNILLYKKFKVYFTNTPFYISRLSNVNTFIYERVDGYSGSVQNAHYGDSNNIATNGIYSFVSQNRYSTSHGGFYRVYFQSHQTYPILRNVSYLRLDENNKLQNYCLEYALLEVSTNFPSDLLLKVSYKDLISENAVEVEFSQNTIIYNVGKSPKQYEVIIEDIFGNTLTQYITIYPSQTPTLVNEKLMDESKEQSYHTYGFAVPIMTNEGYKPYLFSTKAAAYEYALYHIFEENSFDLLTQNDVGVYTLNYSPNSQTTTFYDNASLMAYLNALLDEIIIEKVILPSERNEYGINDKKMYESNIYLQKQTNLFLEMDFILFETYKVEFSYFNFANELLKEGIITHTGEFQYKHSLFKILADEIEEKWQDGYVIFKEYSIASTQPNEYIGYIKANIPNVQIKELSGLKTKIITVLESKQIITEQFSIMPIQNDTQAVIDIIFNNETVRYHNSMLNNLKFNKAGLYQVNIYLRNGKVFSFNVTIQNINNKVMGVENFATTTQEVIYTTTNKNAKIYIDGVLLQEFELTLEDEVRAYTFEAGINRDVVIVEGNLYFCFKQQQGSTINFLSFNQFDQYNYSIVTLRHLYSYENNSVATLSNLEQTQIDFELYLNELNDKSKAHYQTIYTLQLTNLQEALNTLNNLKTQIELMNETEQYLLNQVNLQAQLLKQINIDYSNIFVTDTFINRVASVSSKNFELQQLANVIIEQFKNNLRYLEQIDIIENLITVTQQLQENEMVITLFQNEVNDINTQLSNLQFFNIASELGLIENLKQQLLQLQTQLPGLHQIISEQSTMLSTLKDANHTIITTELENQINKVYIKANELELKLQQASVIIIGNQTFASYTNIIKTYITLQNKVLDAKKINYFLQGKAVEVLVDGQVRYFYVEDFYEFKNYINYLNQKNNQLEKLKQEIAQFKTQIGLLNLNNISYQNIIKQVDELQQQIQLTKNHIDILKLGLYSNKNIASLASID